jgi:hypothetical protein
MISFDAGDVLKVVSGLRIMEQSIRSLAEFKPESDANDPLQKETREWMLSDLSELGMHLSTLNTRVSIAALTELTIILKDEANQISALAAMDRIAEIAVTFRRELSLRKTFCIETSREQFFAPEPGSYAPDFDVKFPAAIYEIDEAGKCLALGRSTAAVFHLMRAMEIGIKGVSRCIGVADPTKNHDRN